MKQGERGPKGLVLDLERLDALLGDTTPSEPTKPPAGPEEKTDYIRSRVAEVIAKRKAPSAVAMAGAPEPVSSPSTDKSMPGPVSLRSPMEEAPAQKTEGAQLRTLKVKVPLDEGIQGVTKNQKDWTAHFEEGLGQERQGRIHQAAAEFRAAAQQNPDDWRVYFADAACSLRLGDPEAASAALGRAQRLSTDERRIFLLQSLALQMAGSYSEAREGYTRLLSDMPESEELLANLTVVSVALQDGDEATRWADRLEKLAPKSKLTHEALAVAALAREDYATAADSYEWLSRSESPSYEHWYNLGVCCQMLGRLDRARQAYRQALRVRPDTLEAQANLGTVLHEMNDLAGAEEAYVKALRLSPDHSGILSNLAAVAKARGKQDTDSRYDSALNAAHRHRPIGR